MKKERKTEMTEPYVSPGKLGKPSFDENGHRINRNSSTDHRYRVLTNMTNPNICIVNIGFEIEDIAKLRQYVKGKKVKATAPKGRVSRIPLRDMRVSDVVIAYVKSITKNVKLDTESIKWAEAYRAKRMAKRQMEDAMIAGGINRIPKEDQLPRGTQKKIGGSDKKTT